MKTAAILTMGIVLTMGVMGESGAASPGKHEGRAAAQVLGRRAMRNFEAELTKALESLFNFGPKASSPAPAKQPMAPATPPPNPASSVVPETTPPSIPESPPARLRVRSLFRR